MQKEELSDIVLHPFANKKKHNIRGKLRSLTQEDTDDHHRQRHDKACSRKNHKLPNGVDAKSTLPKNSHHRTWFEEEALH